jgi:hypothetical protein
VSAAFYVDALRHHRRGTCFEGDFCHLATDGELDELHAFASTIGVPRRAFHAHPDHPHYDLSPARRAAAVQAGAREVGSKELVRRCFRRP